MLIKSKKELTQNFPHMNKEIKMKYGSKVTNEWHKMCLS